MGQKPESRKSFRFRVKNISLTHEQFKELVEKHLRWECSGLMCDIYIDYKPEQGLFWDTECWDLTDYGIIQPYLVLSGLVFFAQRFLNEKRVSTSWCDVISIEQITAEY